MARKKRVMYDFPELYRQDKMDDFIFAYFEGVRDTLPTAKQNVIALNFQKKFHLTEEQAAIDIILASYQRSLHKYQKMSKLYDI